jgi:hypothetical protein
MPKWLFCAVALFAAYFPAALYFESSYVSPVPQGPFIARIQLLPPFETYGFASVANHETVQKLNYLGNDPRNRHDRRSPIVVYENGRPLGPAHNNFSDIATLGMGRFAHWQEHGIAFSASDNSNPSVNGRKYWAAAPSR